MLCLPRCQVSGDISTFVANAEAAVRDIPPEQVSVPSVTELSREAFVAGVNATLSVRDHIKLHLLPPARLEEENEEAQVRQKLRKECRGLA